MVKATLKASVANAELELFSVFERAMKQRSGSFAALETQALEVANEMVRRYLEAELRRMSARYETEILGDISPRRIDRMDAVVIAGAMPALDALFADDGSFDWLVHFQPNHPEQGGSRLKAGMTMNLDDRPRIYLVSFR